MRNEQPKAQSPAQIATASGNPLANKSGGVFIPGGRHAAVAAAEMQAKFVAYRAAEAAEIAAIEEAQRLADEAAAEDTEEIE